jgi:hypothetical protein
MDFYQEFKDWAIALIPALAPIVWSIIQRSRKTQKPDTGASSDQTLNQ